MKFVELKSAIAFALVFLPALTNAHGASSVRFESAIADHEIVALTHTCDPDTGLPVGGNGACAGIETLNGSISGGLNATYFAEVNFATLADGTTPFTSFDVISGTVDGHGSGSFVVLEVCRLAPTLDVTCRWSVIAGGGTDDFVDLTGAGKTTATYDPLTGLAAGRFTGVLYFRH